MYSGRFFTPLTAWKSTGPTGAGLVFCQPVYRPAEAGLPEAPLPAGGKDYFVLTTNVDHCFRRRALTKAALLHPGGLRPLPVFRALPSGHLRQRSGHPPDGGGTGEYADSAGTGPPLPPLRQADDDERCARTTPLSRTRAGTRRRSDTQTLSAPGGAASALPRAGGVGMNTPASSNLTSGRKVYQNPKARYFCINKGQSYAPKEIADRSICLAIDAAQTAAGLKIAHLRRSVLSIQTGCQWKTSGLFYLSPAFIFPAARSLHHFD